MTSGGRGARRGERRPMAAPPAALTPPQDLEPLLDAIFAAAGEGRMDLDFLKEIAASLCRHFRLRAAEVVWGEGGRLLHAKALGGRPPALSAWREKKPEGKRFAALLETLPAASADRLLGALAPFTDAPPTRIAAIQAAAGGGALERPAASAVIGIPAGRVVAGVAALTFSAGDDPPPAPALERLGRAVALSIGLNRSRFELRERVKELSCMYEIAALAADAARPLAELLGQAAALLPQAYLHPEITRARIVLDGAAFATPGFRESALAQSAPIAVAGRERGRIEVVYLEPRPELDEGPFLADERRLLDSIAREIARIVEHREAEQERAQLTERLRQAERLATIGRLAAGVAHELNEPLTGILGFAELLKDLPGMPAEAARDLGRIETAALHAREVVRNLLLFARQITPRPGRVGVNRVVAEALDLFRERLRERGIALRTRLDPALAEIPGDAAQIRQIVMNLVANAIQAMAGGGRLAVETARSGGEASIAVRDTGPGVPPELREKIFLPFFTTREAELGTGLGLAVVHGIVTSHRGRIEVESTPGRGAVFRVFLPLASEGVA